METLIILSKTFPFQNNIFFLVINGKIRFFPQNSSILYWKQNEVTIKKVGSKIKLKQEPLESSSYIHSNSNGGIENVVLLSLGFLKRLQDVLMFKQ